MISIPRRSKPSPNSSTTSANMERPIDRSEVMICDSSDDSVDKSSNHKKFQESEKSGGDFFLWWNSLERSFDLGHRDEPDHNKSPGIISQFLRFPVSPSKFPHKHSESSHDEEQLSGESLDVEEEPFGKIGIHDSRDHLHNEVIREIVGTSTDIEQSVKVDMQSSQIHSNTRPNAETLMSTKEDFKTIQLTDVNKSTLDDCVDNVDYLSKYLVKASIDTSPHVGPLKISVNNSKEEQPFNEKFKVIEERLSQSIDRMSLKDIEMSNIYKVNDDIHSLTNITSNHNSKGPLISSNNGTNQERKNCYAEKNVKSLQNQRLTCNDLLQSDPSTPIHFNDSSFRGLNNTVNRDDQISKYLARFNANSPVHILPSPKAKENSPKLRLDHFTYANHTSDKYSDNKIKKIDERLSQSIDRMCTAASATLNTTKQMYQPLTGHNTEQLNERLKMKQTSLLKEKHDAVATSNLITLIQNIQKITSVYSCKQNDIINGENIISKLKKLDRDMDIAVSECSTLMDQDLQMAVFVTKTSLKNALKAKSHQQKEAKSGAIKQTRQIQKATSASSNNTPSILKSTQSIDLDSAYNSFDSVTNTYGSAHSTGNNLNVKRKVVRHTSKSTLPTKQYTAKVTTSTQKKKKQNSNESREQTRKARLALAKKRQKLSKAREDKVRAMQLAARLNSVRQRQKIAVKGITIDSKKNLGSREKSAHKSNKYWR